MNDIEIRLKNLTLMVHEMVQNMDTLNQKVSQLLYCIVGSMDYKYYLQLYTNPFMMPSKHPVTFDSSE